MKGLLPTSILLMLLAIDCKKNSSNDASSKLPMIQHKWALVSRNGEVLRYIGTDSDYYNFSANNILYRSIATSHDTSYYQLSPGNDNILLLFPIANGIKSDTAESYSIRSLTATQLVLAVGLAPVGIGVDSLKR